jgi:hypothetical protein
MSAMAEMSRAIRLELQKHGSTLKDIPDDVLTQFVQITGAFYADLAEEWERRGLRKEET